MACSRENIIWKIHGEGWKENTGRKGVTKGKGKGQTGDGTVPDNRMAATVTAQVSAQDTAVREDGGGSSTPLDPISRKESTLQMAAGEKTGERKKEEKEEKVGTGARATVERGEVRVLGHTLTF